MNERISLCISGISGRMGQIIERLALHDPAIGTLIGVDVNIPQPAEGLFGPARLAEALALSRSDVLLIFHNDPLAAVSQTEIAAKLGVPVIIGTTGLEEHHGVMLFVYSKDIPVLPASNFSLGVAVQRRLIALAASMLPVEYQPEVVDKHHAKKLDAPSGTAMMLAKTICEARQWDPATAIQCGRVGRSQGPRANEIVGIQTLRAGTISGTHEVTFAGPGEVVEINHVAQTPDIFAQGALAAVKWIIGKAPGVYSIDNVLEG
ncbi:MAG: 4-hydroxy-tetrahydrodipicolinate reductase [Candidatus Buchananbacteria bacterium RIFCSPHIGHO2_01_FULL_44_11]|uniref:4-hydroxy-tetrahydrodipicolinate reductase n=1 Tax=Candidatus Buchananbacteria bacterium RIFCSPHIGHO2_01_FULL_44_11 TaxID=1797535 RepID=A0A1G1Y300_9BACT|nr:MAG: 4-hydroxy-tetrahydrodipicolinate reductase [Candidatus Buchananbacteria bacterium RIFCSPHIGHO2_01_FULL_44_11]